MHPRRLVVGARWPPVPRSNEAVHPGEMDLRDGVETASQLFVLVKAIADQMITQPKLRDALYNTLPQAKRDGIEARDKKAKSAAP